MNEQMNSKKCTHKICYKYALEICYECALKAVAFNKKYPPIKFTIILISHNQVPTNIS